LSSLHSWRSALIRIVSLLSVGRSGSTLASRLLNELPGWFACGEVDHLLGLLSGDPPETLGYRECGCHRLPMDCEVWGPIIADAAAERAAGRLPPDGARRLLQRYPSRRRLPAFVLPHVRRRELEAARALGPMLERWCRALERATGAHVFVDESKSARFAYLLDRMPWADVTMVEVVRDPRGVVNSWSKPKPHPTRPEDWLPEMGVVRSVEGWIENTIESALVRRWSSASPIIVRYEDLARDPQTFVRTVASLVGDPGAEAKLVVDRHNVVDFGPNHIYDANPDKFASGPTRIKVNDEWRRSMARPARIATTVATAPFLLRFRYPLFAGRSGAESEAAE